MTTQQDTPNPYPGVHPAPADGPNVLLDQYPTTRRALDRAKAERGVTIATVAAREHAKE